jgi:hypothetical protein
MKAGSRTKTPLTTAYPGTATKPLDKAALTSSTNGAFVFFVDAAACPAFHLA